MKERKGPGRKWELGEASCMCLCSNMQGIVYFDSAVLGWRPVVGKWLADREEQEAKCLLKYFEQIMDSVMEFVLHKSGYAVLTN